MATFLDNQKKKTQPASSPARVVPTSVSPAVSGTASQQTAAAAAKTSSGGNTFLDRKIAGRGYSSNAAFVSALNDYAAQYDKYAAGWKSQSPSALSNTRSDLLLYAGGQRDKAGSSDSETYKYYDDIVSSLTEADPVALYDTYSRFRNGEQYNAAVSEANEWQKKYGRYGQAADFADKSRYKSTATGTAAVASPWTGMYTDTGYGDLIYDYINRDPDAVGIYNANAVVSKAAFTGTDSSYLQEMTDDEIALFNYIYATEGKDKAYEYVTDLTENLNWRQRERRTLEQAEFAKNEPLKAAAWSVLSAPLKGLSFVGQVTDYIGDKDIDQNAGYNKFSYLNTTIRSAQTAEIEKKWGKIGTFGYQTAMSMADFLYARLITGGAATGKVGEAAALGIMGAGAAADTVIDMLDRGVDDTRAFTLGTIAGAAEIVTEKIGMDALFDKALKGRDAFKYFLRAALSEGAEEGLSDIINWAADDLYDLFTGQSESEWKRMIREKGLSAAIKDRASEFALDVAGGALSGAVMAGASVGTSALRSAPLTSYNTEIEDIVRETINLAPDSTVAQRMRQQLDGGRTSFSGLAIGNLLAEHDAAKVRQAVTQQLTERGVSENTEALADVITKQAMGEELSGREQRLLRGSAVAEQIARELDADAIRSGEQTPQYWVGNIGTRMYNTSEYNRSIYQTRAREANAAAEEAAKRAAPIEPVRAAEVAEDKLTGNETLDAVVNKALGKELSGNDVRPILADKAALSTLENAVGDLGLQGKTASEQRAIVKDAVTRYAEESKTVSTAAAPASVSADVESVAQRYGRQAGAIRSIYNMSPVADIDEFAAAVDAAVSLGRDGGTETQALTSGATQVLSEAQRRAAFWTGQAMTAQTKTEASPQDRLGRNGDNRRQGGDLLWREGSGVVRSLDATDVKTLNERFGEKLNGKSQHNTVIRILRAISKLTGFTIALYDSSTADYAGANGEFDWATDVVAIDISAGVMDAKDAREFAKYVALRTFCHEFTHVGEKWAPGEFNLLRTTVVETLSKRGSYDLEARVNEIREADRARLEAAYVAHNMSAEEAAAKAEQNMLSYEKAVSEIVAEGMTDVLPESRFMEAVYAKSYTLGEKLRKALSEFAARVSAYWNQLVSNPSREAQALKVSVGDTVKYMDGIVDMWDKMATAAVENYNRAMNDEGYIHEQAEIERPEETQYQARDIRGNVVVDESVDEEKVRAKLQDIYDNPKQNLDFTFPILKEAPFVYEYATKIPGNRSFVMHGVKAAQAMLNRNSDDHDLGVDGLMQVIGKLDDPDYIIYQNEGRNAGHYAAILVIGEGDAVASVDIGNYRAGINSSVNGESGYYDVLITAYNKLDEKASKKYKSFEDYILHLLGETGNDIVYNKEKDEESLHVALSERLSRLAEDSSSEETVTQYTANSQEQSRTFLEEDGEKIQYQDRTSPLTDREVLSIAADELAGEDYAGANVLDVKEMTPGEKDALRIFRNNLESLRELEEKRAEEGRLYREQQFGENVDREAAKKTLNRMQVLDGQIEKASAEVLKAENAEVLKKVLHKAHKVVENTDLDLIQRQQREQSFTDREVLEQAATDLLDRDERTKYGKLGDAERDALKIFRKRLDALREAEDRRENLLEQKRDLMDGRQSKDIVGDEKVRLRAIQKELAAANAGIKAAESLVLTAENAAAAKKVLRQARSIVESEARTAARNRTLAAYKERREESETVKKYRASVEKKVQKLSDKLLKNSDKEHVPQALQKPLGEFLETIDFTSRRALRGGEATKADLRYADRLDRLRQVLQKQADYMADPNGDDAKYPGFYLDLPPELLDVVQKSINDANSAMKGLDLETNEVYSMDAAQLKDLDFILSVISHSINTLNTTLANARYANIPDMAKASMKHFEQMGNASQASGLGIAKYVLWKNATPYYAFKRFGEAGVALFDGFTRGWERLAFNAQEIIDFTNKTYTAQEVRDWKHEINYVTLEDGSKIRITTAQIMELSQLLNRAQARRHIEAGGIRIGNIETRGGVIQDVTHYHMTSGDLQTLVGLLTKRQLQVATALRRYMGRRGGEWGNEVSMARFGYDFYTEGEDYYTIRTDANGRPMKDTDAQSSSMFRLLNLSASKSLNPNANNALIVGDIFDTFADHMADMAKLNALGLPLLDAIKWYNYTERTHYANGTMDEESLKKSMEAAYGAAAGSYFRTLLKDINGVREGGDRNSNLLSKVISNYKIAAVAANLRVALLQPTSYVRAMYVLSPRSMLSAFAFKKNAYKEALANSGTAVWKSLGYYDTDISRSMRSQIEHDETLKDKIVDASLKLAEIGDQRTWGRLWVACKIEAKSRNNNLEGDALNAATADLFREVIYATQVMDSTLTRSEAMRGTTLWDKVKTAFASEPTLSFNILMDAASTFSQDARKMGAKGAFVTNRGKLGLAFITYAASAAAAAVVESLMDAARDDDDYETFLQKWSQAFWGEKGFLSGNLGQDLTILGKIPQVKDIVNTVLGSKSSDMSIASVESITNAFRIWKETIRLANGSLEKATDVTWNGKMTTYGKIYKTLQALSQLSGIAGSSFMRDALAIWNSTVGAADPSLKLKTYDPGTKNSVKYAYLDGALTAEEAAAALVEAGEAKDENEAYWTVYGFDGSKKYGDLSTAIKAGDASAYQTALNELTAHGVEEKDVYSQVKTIVKEMVLGTDTAPGTISADEAVPLLMQYADLSEEDATATAAKWKYADWDTDGNGLSQDEISFALESGNYSQQQKENIWGEFGYKTDYSDVQEKAAARVELDENAVTYNSANWEEGLIDASLSDGDKDLLVNAYGGTWFAAPYTNLREAGYTPRGAYELLTGMDADGNHSIKQAEAFNVLRFYTDAEASKIWSAFDWATAYDTYKAKHS